MLLRPLVLMELPLELEERRLKLSRTESSAVGWPSRFERGRRPVLLPLLEVEEWYLTLPWKTLP